MLILALGSVQESGPHQTAQVADRVLLGQVERAGELADSDAPVVSAFEDVAGGADVPSAQGAFEVDDELALVVSQQAQGPQERSAGWASRGLIEVAQQPLFFAKACDSRGAGADHAVGSQGRVSAFCSVTV
ncbi:hypothetical protein ACFVYG_22510 [Streptomyces sp. NPDC058256]|uniref:hypothetical protein n=1 Tax=Streptomyces sp. NPDC058256 TaxID=3346408 RepID=UPI0036E8656B